MLCSYNRGPNFFAFLLEKEKCVMWTVGGDKEDCFIFIQEIAIKNDSNSQD